jgi:uncharacterized protein YggL (DUF469 family)
MNWGDARSGPYNGRYHLRKNKIPYCREDAQEMVEKVLKKEKAHGVEVSGLIYSAICETAEHFMKEVIASSPAITTGAQTFPVVLLLDNVKDKFPEIATEAKELFGQHLERYCREGRRP